MTTSYYFYISAIIIFYIVYIIAFLGYNINKQYIRALSTIIQLFIGLYLAIRFFPYKFHKLERGDDEIIFGCAMFLLANVGFTELILNSFESSFGLSQTGKMPQNISNRDDNPLLDTIHIIDGSAHSATAAP